MKNLKWYAAFHDKRIILMCISLFTPQMFVRDFSLIVELKKFAVVLPMTFIQTNSIIFNRFAINTDKYIDSTIKENGKLLAIKKARELFIKKQRNPEMYEDLSDKDLLNKASILIKGKITNTALILLGKSEMSYLFDGFIPRITWTLYGISS